MEIEKKVISVEDMGKVIGCSRVKAYQLVRDGKVPCLKLGPHKIVIPLAALERFLQTAGSFRV